MAFCSSCGGEVAADLKFCPSCGGSMEAGGGAAAPGVSGTASATAAADSDNLMGALAYVPIIAIVFLLIEPHKNNRFIRFHCFQSLFYVAALFVLWIAISILGVVLAFIPFGGFIATPLWFVLTIGQMVVWVLLAVRAYQGQQYRLPMLGDLAAKQV